MSSWEEIADEVAPLGAPPKSLATGATRRAAPRPSAASEADDDASGLMRAPLHPRVISCPPLECLNGQATLESLLGGAEVRVAAHGAYASIVRSPQEYSPDFADLAERLERVLQKGKIRKLAGVPLADLLFLDIETAGTSSSAPLFLIGTLHFARGEEALEPRVEFFLAREREEEEAALAAFHRLARGKYLVTFNGRHFDWPYIAGRSSRHGLLWSEPDGHLDALFLARSMWRGATPNCRLVTLETFVCGRARVDDVPSNLVPRAYLSSLQQIDPVSRARTLAPVVHHNALDVLTTAELVVYAGEGRTWRDRFPEA
jgi:uncharacterized protein YprB with RNaseH-like and TPR domain